jgi:alkanesulfonate monooxygenase SsuD/methylene tetrahydromethanopterin reductase-like flavin-dependent oxidoreductase (luciferase family)
VETININLGDNPRNPITGEQISDGHKHFRLCEQAAAAERAGFDVIQLGEHHYNDLVLSSPEVALAAISQHTTTLRLGTAVTTLPTLDPVRVAEAFTTLDGMSNGRAEICVGRGAFAKTYDVMDMPQESGAEIFEELTELLFRLLNEEDVTWKGQWRQPVDSVTIRPRPVQQSIPMWCGSTRSIDLVARLGLGAEWVAAIAPVDSLKTSADRLHEAWEREGNDGDPQIRLGAHFHVAPTSQQARREFRPFHMTYLEATGQLEMASFQMDNVNKLLAEAGAGQAAGPSLTVEESGDIIAFCGSPEEIIDRVGAARDLLGLSGIGMMLDLGGMSDEMVIEQIERFGADVLPAIKAM